VRGRPRKDVIRLEVPRTTDDVIQERVRPLLPREVYVYWNRVLVETVVRAAYVQGALDAMVIAEHHPELIRVAKGEV